MLIADIKGISRLFRTASLFQHGLIQDLSNPDARTSRAGNENTLISQTLDIFSFGAEGS